MLLQHIGTGTDKGGKTVLGLAVLHDVGRNKSKGACNRKLREHRVVGFLHLNNERVGIRRFYAFKKTHHFKPGVTRFVVNQRIKVRLDSIGVKHVAVGELQVRANFEGVHAAVGRDVPAFCYCSVILAVIAKGDEPFKHHFLSEHFAGIKVRIQIAKITVIDEYQSVFTLSCCVNRRRRSKKNSTSEERHADSAAKRTAGKAEGLH